MAPEVHALVESTNDAYAVVYPLEKQDVPSDRKLEVICANLAFVPTARIIGDGANASPQAANITLSAILAPTLGAELPNVVEVLLCAR